MKYDIKKIFIAAQTEFKKGNFNRELLVNNNNLKNIMFQIKKTSLVQMEEIISELDITDEILEQIAQLTNLSLTKYLIKNTDIKQSDIIKSETKNKMKSDNKNNYTPKNNNIDNNKEIESLKQTITEYEKILDFRNHSEYITFSESDLDQHYKQFLTHNHKSSNYIIEANNQLIIIKEAYIINKNKGES